MKLKLYLEINRITKTRLANELGVSVAMISRIVNEGRRPSPGLAARIEKATKGNVGRLELLYP